jgi:aspartokinase
LNAPDFERVSTRIRALGGVVERGNGVVTLVGVGVGSDPGVLGEALAALPCPALHVQSSPLSLSAVVPEARLADAERAWHAVFVGENAQGRAA